MFCVLPATSRGGAQAPVAASASTACAFVGRGERARQRERGAQDAVAEHLRRLRLPEAGAILGAQHARRRRAGPRASACRRPEPRAARRRDRRRARRRAAAAHRPERRAARRRGRGSSRRRRSARQARPAHSRRSRRASRRRSAAFPRPARVADDRAKYASSGASATTIASSAKRAASRSIVRASSGLPPRSAYCFGRPPPKRLPPPAAGISAMRRADGASQCRPAARGRVRPGGERPVAWRRSFMRAERDASCHGHRRAVAVFHGAVRPGSGSSAARMRGGTGAGRCVARSTQTWTKCPVAAGSSSPWRKRPIS